MLMDKYAARKKERYMSAPTKGAVVGTLGGLTALPFVNPLDVLEVRAKAGIKDPSKPKKPTTGKMKFRKRPYKLKALKAGRFVKKYWGGMGYAAMKRVPAQAIAFGTMPIYKALIDKRFKTLK